MNLYQSVYALLMQPLPGTKRKHKFNADFKIRIQLNEILGPDLNAGLYLLIQYTLLCVPLILTL